MKKKLQLLNLLFFISTVAFAQLKIMGKGVIGGDVMPSDVFQVNGDMQLEEPSPFLRLKTTNNANAGLNWKNGSDSNIGAFFLEPATGSFFFDVNGFSTTGATAEFTFDKEGELGIGYNNPQAPLHVFNEKTEIGRFESLGNSKWLAFYQNGQRKGRIWNFKNTMVLDAEEAAGQIQLKVGGTTQLSVGEGGDLLARATVRRATFTFAHPNGSGTNTGLTLVNDGGGKYWNLYTVGTTGDFELFQNGVFKGRFLASDGSYTPTSDKTYKSNIEDVDRVLDRIGLLKPKTYTMKHDKSSRQHIGFIAQEVEEVFPQMVYRGPVGDTDEQAYTMNYNSMAVVAIKGIQELMADEQVQAEEQKALKADLAHLEEENLALRQDLQDMTRQLKEMKAILNRVALAQEDCCRLAGGVELSAPEAQPANTVGSAAELRQNMPNPFVDETRISYFIPGIRSRAYLQLADINGRLLKQIEIDQTGEGQLSLDTKELAAGTYTYSLFVDGHLIGTKQMLLVK